MAYIIEMDSKVVWIQIPVNDLERAATFYKRVFGASFEFKELNNMPHAIFQPNSIGESLLTGALVKFSDDRKPGSGPVLFFEATGKFHDILELTEGNGGNVIIPKTLIKAPVDEGSRLLAATYIDGKTGWYAHILDCEGNRIGLYGSS